MASTRRHQRYPVKWTVQVRAADWGEAQQLVIGNVSRGGLFIRSAHPIPSGTRLEVTLTLPEQMVLKVEGQVVHSIGPNRADADGLASGFGVRFDERFAIDLNLLEGIAASNGAGNHAFAFEPDRYISMAAVVVDAETGVTTETTAHKLVEAPAVDVDMEDSEDPEVAQIVSLPEEEERLPTGMSPAVRPHEQPSASIQVQIPDKPAADQVKRSPARPPQNFTGPLPVLSDEEPVFGIDFGTTYTSIAVVEGNQVRVLQDAEGQTSLPSVVCFPDEGPVLVGWPAKEKIATNPATTVSSAKRLLGRRFRDPNLQPYLAHTPVRFREAPDGLVMAEIFGEPVPVVQIVAQVLRRIAEIGEAAALCPVRRAVFSAPVAYTSEREALRRAADIAGLEVAGFIDEPVSAAMAFGMGMGGGQTVGVYDFGGGTLDITVLRNKPKRGYEVLAKAGEPWLGGDDFDLAIAGWAADQFWRAQKVDLRQRQVEWQRLLLHCEQAKRRLSVQREVELRVRAIVLSLKGPIDLRLQLSRELLDQICAKLVDRSLETVQECLDAAELRPDQIDQVVLTGGTSRSPLVRRRLQEFFGREITVNYDPELAIVSGNALYGRFMALKRSAGQ